MPLTALLASPPASWEMAVGLALETGRAAAARYSGLEGGRGGWGDEACPDSLSLCQRGIS